jgi:hypothetical protein
MKKLRALKWLFALGAVSCAGSTEPLGDSYQGYVDGTGFDSKFLPGACASSGSDRCYRSMKGNVNGVAMDFYNLGVVATSALPKDSGNRPYLPVSLLKQTVHGFQPTETCEKVKDFDQRTDAYPQDVQWAVFDSLPMTASTPVLPVLKVSVWEGVSGAPCNAIKDATSLKDGDFGGRVMEERLAMAPVIDMTAFVRAKDGTTNLQPARGWYRGLQLAYLDGSFVEQMDVTVDANGTTVPALKTMDGVFIKPTTGTAPSPGSSSAALVFAAAPGDAAFSQVVRLREITAPTGVQPSSYKRLCYDPGATGCPADSIDMTKANTYNGVLFLVPALQ